MLVSRATLIRSCVLGLRLSVFIRDTRTEVHHHGHDLMTLELRGQPPKPLHYIASQPSAGMLPISCEKLFFLFCCFFFLNFVWRLFWPVISVRVLFVCVQLQKRGSLEPGLSSLEGARGSKRWPSGRILRFVDTPVWTESPNHFHTRGRRS